MLQQISAVFVEPTVGDAQADFMNAGSPAQPLGELFACANVFAYLIEQSKRCRFNAVSLCGVDIKALLHGGDRAATYIFMF